MCLDIAVAKETVFSNGDASRDSWLVFIQFRGAPNIHQLFGHLAEHSVFGLFGRTIGQIVKKIILVELIEFNRDNSKSFF